MTTQGPIGPTDDGNGSERRETAVRVTADPDKFQIIPNWIAFHPDLSTHDRIVWLALRSYANLHDDRCYPSHDTLADRCGVSIRTVRRSIQALEVAGLVAVTSNAKGGRQSNTYHLKTDRPERPSGTDRAAREADPSVREAAPGAAREADELETYELKERTREVDGRSQAADVAHAGRLAAIPTCTHIFDANDGDCIRCGSNQNADEQTSFEAEPGTDP